MTSEDTPSLAATEALTARLGAVSWFAALGNPPIADEEAAAAGYLAALGLADVTTAWAADWPAAERLTRGEVWSAEWWDAEERERQTLLARAQGRAGERPLAENMDRLMRTASDTVMAPAAMAATRAGIADQALARVAAGAAIQGAYQAGLALAADAGRDHPFAIKFRLFDCGRWPLGIIEDKFRIF